MLPPELLAHLAHTYPESFLRWCRNPTHCRLMTNFHARGARSSANGEEIEFRLRLSSDGLIAEMAFTFEGRPVLLAAGEAVCTLCEGISCLQVSALDESQIAAELGEIPPSDHFDLMLAAEALRTCMLDAVAVLRHPWKGPYVK